MVCILQVDWRPVRITDLIGHLWDLVRMQYTEVRQSLCGLGDLQLAPAFAHHTVTQMNWNSMTQVVCAICFVFALSPYIYFVTFCIHTYPRHRICINHFDAVAGREGQGGRMPRFQQWRTDSEPAADSDVIWQLSDREGQSKNCPQKKDSDEGRPQSAAHSVNSRREDAETYRPTTKQLARWATSNKLIKRCSLTQYKRTPVTRLPHQMFTAISESIS